jgi:hypothetical protein
MQVQTDLRAGSRRKKCECGNYEFHFFSDWQIHVLSQSNNDDHNEWTFIDL